MESPRESKVRPKARNRSQSEMEGHIASGRVVGHAVIFLGRGVGVCPAEVLRTYVSEADRTFTICPEDVPVATTEAEA